jgi:hypothetical protein
MQRSVAVAPALATSVLGDASATLRPPHAAEAAAAAAAARDVKATPLPPVLVAAAASFAPARPAGALPGDAIDAAAVAALAVKRASVEAEVAAHGFCAAAAPGRLCELASAHALNCWNSVTAALLGIL